MKNRINTPSFLPNDQLNSLHVHPFILVSFFFFFTSSEKLYTVGTRSKKMMLDSLHFDLLLSCSFCAGGMQLPYFLFHRWDRSFMPATYGSQQTVLKCVASFCLEKCRVSTVCQTYTGKLHGVQISMCTVFEALPASLTWFEPALNQIWVNSQQHLVSIHYVKIK